MATATSQLPFLGRTGRVCIFMKIYRKTMCAQCACVYVYKFICIKCIANIHAGRRVYVRVYTVSTYLATPFCVDSLVLVRRICAKLCLHTMKRLVMS